MKACENSRKRRSSPSSHHKSKEKLCKICNREITIDLWDSHCRRKSHVDSIPSCITITGLSNGSSALDQYFSQFGEVEQVNVAEGKVDYVYTNHLSYTKVIHSHHVSLGIPFTLSWKHPQDKSTMTIRVKAKKNDLTSAADTVKTSKLAMVKKLKLCGSSCVTHSVQLLWQHTLAFKASLDLKLLTMGDDLRLLLGDGSKIILFGSTITTLNYVGSNVDVYVETSRARNEEHMTDLLKNSDKFCYPTFMPNNGFPIVKCFHESGVWLEFYVKNMIPVFTSSLLKYYTKLHEKIGKLLLVLKLWSECRNLRKSGLKNYALYWMVIFYLQRCYSLPSVRDLQQDCEPQFIEGWVCAYRPLASDYHNERVSKANYRQLLGGFFKFYTEFDFMVYVICPYLGEVVEKVDFLRNTTLPNNLSRYKQRSIVDHKFRLPVTQGLSVQDPVEQTRNLTADLGFETSAKFAHYASVSLEILKRAEVSVLYKMLTWEQSQQNMHKFDLVTRMKNKEEWQDWMTTTTVKVLKSVMKCTVKSTITDKMATFRCKTTEDVWYERLDMMRRVREQSGHLDGMEFEERVTANGTIFKFMPAEFQVNMEFQEDAAVVELRGSSSYKYFYHIKYFLKLKLQQWLKRWEDRSGNLREDIYSNMLNQWTDDENASSSIDQWDLSDEESDLQTFTVTEVRKKDENERRQRKSSKTRSRSPIKEKRRSRSPIKEKVRSRSPIKEKIRSRSPIKERKGRSSISSHKSNNQTSAETSRKKRASSRSPQNKQTPHSSANHRKSSRSSSSKRTSKVADFNHVKRSFKSAGNKDGELNTSLSNGTKLTPKSNDVEPLGIFSKMGFYEVRNDQQTTKEKAASETQIPSQPHKKFPSVKSSSQIKIRLKKDEQTSMPEPPPPPNISTETASSRPKDRKQAKDNRDEKKIKVLNRCRATLGFLGVRNSAEFDGRLRIQSTSSLLSERRSKLEGRSPLLKGLKIRFKYTNPSKACTQDDHYEMALITVVNFVEMINSTDEKRTRPRSLEKRSDCNECEQRNKKKFASIGIQVSEDDLEISRRKKYYTSNPRSSELPW